MIRVVTYRRVSTEDQANNDLSLPAQSKAMARWLAERLDHKFVQEFSDEGVSAYAPAALRPGFQEMIKFCLKNHIDVLLVHKLDRFSRDRRECAIFKELLSRKEVKVRSVSEDFDPDTAQGVLLEGILETLAQFFSMNLSSEVLKGMQENAERGWFNGGSTPFGYKVVKVQQGAREYSRPGRLRRGDPRCARPRDLRAGRGAGQGLSRHRGDAEPSQGALTGRGDLEPRPDRLHPEQPGVRRRLGVAPVQEAWAHGPAAHLARRLDRRPGHPYGARPA